MTILLMILAAAALALGLAHWLKLPLIPLLVLSGLALSALGLVGDAALFQEALLLGLAFLLFSAGAEMNPSRVGAQQTAAIRVGLGQFIVFVLVGLGLAWLLGFDWLTAVYVALALAASSTLVVIRLLKQRQQLFEPFGRLVLGVLLVQDGLIILALAVVNGLEGGATAVFVSVNGTLGLMLLAYLCQRWATPWLLLHQGLDEEERLLVALALLFFFIGAADLIQAPMAIGAFLAGVALSSFPVSGILRGQFASLTDFFLALFFVTLGALLTLPTWDGLLLALVLAAVVLALTPVIVSFIARRAGITDRAALESGFLLAQTSEFSLVVAIVGVQQGHLDAELLSVLTIATVLTMMATPLLSADRVTIQLLHWLAQRRPLTAPSLPPNHILLMGCGERGRPLLEWLLARDEPVVVVDDDAAVVNQLKGRGVTAVYGDAANPQVLAAAGAAQARVIVSTIKRLAENEAFLSYMGQVPVLITLFEPEEAIRIEQLGGKVVLESHVAANEFMTWFADTTTPSS
jgi:Kef-type K+ transport system membrane component KefB